jgi:hypothetical protein
MKLLEEAAALARSKDRAILLGLTQLQDTDVSQTTVQERVFLITTCHPTDHSLRQIVLKN